MNAHYPPTCDTGHSPLDRTLLPGGLPKWSRQLLAVISLSLLFLFFIQSAVDHPLIAQGIAPDGLLSAEEETQLADYSFLKRRMDWLLGRSTAKELVRTVLHEQFEIHDHFDNGVTVAQIVVRIDEDGAPFVCLKGVPAATAQSLKMDSTGRLPWSLSISHSHGVAFCALVFDEERFGSESLSSSISAGKKAEEKADVSSSISTFVGADLEYVEAREDNFVRDYFTADEMALIQEASPSQRDILVTAIWSAKEAALKALRIGLRMDTRKVHCWIQPPLPLTDEWMIFRLQLPPEEGADMIWSGWWRRFPEHPHFVMTLVIGERVVGDRG